MTSQIIEHYTFIFTELKTFTQNHVNVSDKYLHWPCENVKNIYIHRNNISVKCKRLKQVSDLHLHKIYTPAIDTYTHNTGKNLLLLKKSSTQNERNQQTGDS